MRISQPAVLPRVSPISLDAVKCAGRQGSAPLEVTIPTDPCQPQSGSRTVKIWPVLVAVEGDIPFMEKVTKSIGHSAKRACFRCALSGEWRPEAKTVRSAPALLSLLFTRSCHI